MSDHDALLQVFALTAGVAWASGINLYATVALLGLAGTFGHIDLPPGLAVLQDPTTILIAGGMCVLEFLVDKIPKVDSTWDAIHTFIRIPAGALLAAGAIGAVGTTDTMGAIPALSVAAALTGGTLAATTHFIKAGSRVLINRSSRWFSNIGASILGDLLVLGALWLVLKQPLGFAIAFGIFLLTLFWIVPRIRSGAHFLYAQLGRWLGMLPLLVNTPPLPLESSTDSSTSS